MRGAFLILLIAIITLSSNGAVSLDSCRNMAVANNRRIKIAEIKVSSSEYQRKQAWSEYLPALDIEAGYVYNQKSLALIEEDAKLPTMSFDAKTGTYGYNIVTDAEGKPLFVDGSPVPSQVAVLPKSALTYDVHNVFAGAITLSQPIYMGGKIRAMNEITRYAKTVAEMQRDMAIEDVIYGVDVAYWQVVSLKAKERLACSYMEMLDSLKKNVHIMLQQGVATKADLLGVEVKFNEAEVDMLRVSNGVSLARMQLAYVCGLPVNTSLVVEDEKENVFTIPIENIQYDMNEVFHNRSDLNAVERAVKVYEK